jgi:hypothetical protein
MAVSIHLSIEGFSKPPNRSNLAIPQKRETHMLSIIQASEATGLPSSELMLLALTGRISFQRNQETRQIFFDPTALKNGVAYRWTKLSR